MASIVLVNNDNLGLRLQKLILERSGHVISAYNSADNAYAALSQKSNNILPDLIIASLELPGVMSGYEFLKNMQLLYTHSRNTIAVPKFMLQTSSFPNYKSIPEKYCAVSDCKPYLLGAPGFKEKVDELLAPSKEYQFASNN